jgi:hypothetical protein
MRTLAVIALLMAPVMAPLPAIGQAVEIGPGGVQVYPHGGSHAGRECRELRAACMHKEELGEQGQGNCQRYREMCGGGARGYYHARPEY